MATIPDGTSAQEAHALELEQRLAARGIAPPELGRLLQLIDRGDERDNSDALLRRATRVRTNAVSDAIAGLDSAVRCHENLVDTTFSGEVAHACELPSGPCRARDTFIVQHGQFCLDLLAWARRLDAVAAEEPFDAPSSLASPQRPIDALMALYLAGIQTREIAFLWLRAIGITLPIPREAIDKHASTLRSRLHAHAT